MLKSSTFEFVPDLFNKNLTNGFTWLPKNSLPFNLLIVIGIHRSVDPDSTKAFDDIMTQGNFPG
jgi:hypothetical protein